MNSPGTGDCVTAYAPATVANVACGFDVLGMALHTPGDRVTVTRSETPGVRLTAIHGDEGRLPLDADRNTAGVAVQALLAQLSHPAGFSIELFKGMPLASGLGSSAASAVAALLAANALLPAPLPREDLLPFAVTAEAAACGTGHADNVAASLLGGMVLVRSYTPLEVVSLPVLPRLVCATVTPALALTTGASRSVLPESLPLKTAVRQWGNLGAFVAALYQGDYALLGRSLSDAVAAPRRAALIPGFADVRQAALSSGALGCSIAGAGPTLFALCEGEAVAQKAAEAMQHAFRKHRLGSTAHISLINRDGARILSEGASP